jgi:hypothetical protein
LLELNISIDPILNSNLDILNLKGFYLEIIKSVFTNFSYIITIINAIIYNIVSYTVNFEKHFSQTKYQESKIIKLIILLSFNTIISPYFSLLMTTIADSRNGDFLSPYFFFNILSNRIYLFLISTLFLSRALTYLFNILTDFFYYLYKIIYYYYNKKRIKFSQKIERKEFPFIENYTTILTILFLILTYGVSIPIILLPGLIYFILSFLIDKWLLYN